PQVKGGARREVFLAVVLAPQPRVPPVGGRDERRREILVLRDAERGAARAKRLENLVVEPGGVPELEGRADSRRQGRQERLEALPVLLQIRRQLKEDGAEPAAERRRDLEEVVDRVAGLLEPLLVRDPLRRFEHEDETGRDLLRPLRERLGA